MNRHLDPQEAQEVVRLAASRQAVPHDGPTIEGLAEALGLSEPEVERLLTEVRSRQAMSQPRSERRFGDRSAALSAAIVLALVLVVAAIGSAGYLVFGRRGQTSDEMTLAGPSLPAPIETTTVPVMPAPPAVPPSETVGGVTIRTASDGETTIVDGAGGKTKVRAGKDGTVTIESPKSSDAAPQR